MEKTDSIEWFQRCKAIRNSTPVLHHGGYAPVHIDDDNNVLVFKRRLGNEVSYVAINRSESDQTVTFEVDGPASYTNLLDPTQANVVMSDDAAERPTVEVAEAAHKSENGNLTLTLPAYNTAILVAN